MQVTRRSRRWALSVGRRGLLGALAALARAPREGPARPAGGTEVGAVQSPPPPSALVRRPTSEEQAYAAGCPSSSRSSPTSRWSRKGPHRGLHPGSPRDVGEQHPPGQRPRLHRGAGVPQLRPGRGLPQHRRHARPGQGRPQGLVPGDDRDHEGRRQALRPALQGAGARRRLLLQRQPLRDAGREPPHRELDAGRPDQGRPAIDHPPGERDDAVGLRHQLLGGRDLHGAPAPFNGDSLLQGRQEGALDSPQALGGLQWYENDVQRERLLPPWRRRPRPSWPARWP